MSGKRNIKFLSINEIDRIIGACDGSLRGSRDRALLETLFSTGLRISEALALKRALFDNVAETTTLELVIIGKGSYQRVVYFSPRALQAIKEYLDKRTDLRPSLFPMSVRNAQYLVKYRAKLAGIDKFVSPHVLRHSFATDLLRKGVDIRYVCEFLGHRSLSNTMIYTHVVNDQLKKIHEELYNL